MRTHAALATGITALATVTTRKEIDTNKSVEFSRFHALLVVLAIAIGIHSTNMYKVSGLHE